MGIDRIKARIDALAGQARQYRAWAAKHARDGNVAGVRICEERASGFEADIAGLRRGLSAIR